MIGYLRSMQEAEMLAFTDSGCCLHHPQQLLLSGFTGALMGRLVLNLPHHGPSYMYICEHGQTHCIDLKPHVDATATDSGSDQAARK
jgi:hypothetical protein